MNVEIGTEAAQFSEKEYINGIFLAVFYEASSVILRFTVLSLLERVWRGGACSKQKSGNHPPANLPICFYKYACIMYSLYSKPVLILREINILSSTICYNMLML